MQLSACRPFDIAVNVLRARLLQHRSERVFTPYLPGSSQSLDSLRETMKLFTWFRNFAFLFGVDLPSIESQFRVNRSLKTSAPKYPLMSNARSSGEELNATRSSYLLPWLDPREIRYFISCSHNAKSTRPDAPDATERNEYIAGELLGGLVCVCVVCVYNVFAVVESVQPSLADERQSVQVEFALAYDMSVVK